jgi:hypothetical protein
MSTFQLILVCIVAWIGFISTILLGFILVARFDEEQAQRVRERVERELESAYEAASVEPRRELRR